MKRKFAKINILFSAILFINFTTSGQEYKPLIKVKAGDQYNYSSTMTMDMSMSAGGQDIKVTSTGSFTAKNTIDNIDKDENIEVINTTWDINLKTSGMGKDSTINIEGKAGPTYKTKFDKLGNYISKVIIDSSQLNLNIDNNSNSLSIFCEFPDTKLKTGDKWTKDRVDTIKVKQIGGEMGVSGKTEYTFGQKEKINGTDLFKITYSSTLTIEGKGSMMGMDIFIEGTGVANGEIYFDPKNGIINISKSIVEMDMNMAITGAQSMTMPMNQKITITQNLIK